MVAAARKLLPVLVLCFPVAGFSADTLSSSIPCATAIINDWKDQDKVASVGYRVAIGSIISALPSDQQSALQKRLDDLSTASDNSSEMQSLYVRACSARRILRMGGYIDRFRKVVFSQHGARGGAWFHENHDGASGYPGKGLELLTFDGYYGSIEHLVPDGESRDPEVSCDGKSIIFAWRGVGQKYYHLCEMDVATKKRRILTSGDCNDYEPVYLPNGNIMYSSTKIKQVVDCAGNSRVGNMFLCDKDGRYARRIGFDQAPTNYPRVLSSGDVVYCRWDYNDKSHTYAHALFVMNPDGTAQREYYNNNSWWPSMILHQRPIPGTTKLMAMIGGYHSRQSGKIGIIDNRTGFQNGTGLTLLCPIRTPEGDTREKWGSTTKVSVFPKKGPLDTWGQVPPMYAYPFPFDEETFLVSYRPAAMDSLWKHRFGLYFMKSDGTREMLYKDSSCCSPVVLAPRQVPNRLASSIDYRKTTGTFTVMNIYQSQSPVLDNIVPGTIKRLRVCYLNYRSGPQIGNYAHSGLGGVNNGGSTYQTAIATNNASWDAKGIVGETPVYSDGSAAFIVPARTPVYFQALDVKGQVVQTMRSWATLQPGEAFSCVGCHESKIEASPNLPHSIALTKGAQPLEPFYGPMRGYGFVKEVQPILNAKCVKCHSTSTPNGIDLSGNSVSSDVRKWSIAYQNLVKHGSSESFSKYVNWFHAEDSPLLLPPYRAGSSKSPLMPLLEEGHKGVTLTKAELDKIRCWIDIGVPFSGDYHEDLASTSNRDKILANLAARAKLQEEERLGIEQMLNSPTDAAQVGSPLTQHVSPSSMPYLSATRASKSCAGGGMAINITIRGIRPGTRSPLKVLLYRTNGQLVSLTEIPLTNEPSARHAISAPSRGFYLCRLQGGGFKQVAKVALW